MPAIHYFNDDVLTGSEALLRAAIVRENRRRSYRPRPLAPIAIPEPVKTEEPIPPSYVPLGAPNPHWNDVRVIQRVVCHRYGMTIDELLRDTRLQVYVVPRFIAQYLSRDMLGHGWCHLGHRFNRDHASVLHGVRKLKSKMFDDQSLREEVDELRRQCADQLRQHRELRNQFNQSTANELNAEELA